MNQMIIQKMLEQAMNHPGEFNEITLHPRSLNEIEKIYKCNKCGEIFILILWTTRQGDAKSVPVWIIAEKSGIKQLKDKMRVCYRERYISTFGDNNLKPNVENAIDHYDDYALQEMENKRCVMKDCDGILEDLPEEEEQENDVDEVKSSTKGSSQK